MKQKSLLKTLGLLCALLIGGGTNLWAETLTEGFETKGNSTTYNQTVTISEAESDCDIAWSIYYGTVSTNDKITDKQSAQMRWYANASENFPYMMTTTPIDGLSNVTFKGRVSNLNVKVDVSYSTDGNEWTILESAYTFTAAGAAGVSDISVDIPEGGKFIKIGVSSGSTAPSSGNYKLIIDNVVFTYTAGAAPSVAAPKFTVAAGDYFEAINVKVDKYDSSLTYYYTTDGTAPETTSAVYNNDSGIDITETTTLKMIAVDGENNQSNVTSAMYNFPTIYKTIAAFKEPNTTGYLDLTGAQIVYISTDKKYIYLRDESAAVSLYNGGGFTTDLTTGDILSGVISGKYSPYNNMPQIANADISGLTATANETVIAKVITVDEIADNLGNLVKIENTEITENSGKYYIGDVQLYDNFGIGLTFETGKAADISGIAIVYRETYEICPRYESDIVYLTSSESVAIDANGIKTFVSENALDFTGVDAIAAYTVSVAGNYATLAPVKKIAAGTPVILMNANGYEAGAVEAVNVPFLKDEADAVTSNDLKVSDGTADLNGKFVLANKENGVGFYKWAGTTIPAGKIYLDASASARDFIGFAEATGIKTIADGQMSMDTVYDLQGRRVAQPAKGLYIVNGKKVVLK